MRISDWSSDVCSSDLGLGYVFFFNLPGTPLHVLYGSLTLQVTCTIAHFLTTAQLTASAALRPLDGEFAARAAERRVGKGRVRPCSTRWAPYHKKKKRKKQDTSQQNYEAIKRKT